MGLRIASNRPKNRVVSESEVKQLLDFEELFGVDLSEHRTTKLAMAQALIDRILERTEKGKDINGKAFTGYSKEYKQSLAYKAWKSGSTPNLELRGDMLGSLDILEEQSNAVTIGWDDKKQTAKAYAHNEGRENDSKVTVPQREFFGVTQADVDAVAGDFSDALSRIKEGGQDRRKSALDILEAFERATSTGAAVSGSDINTDLFGGFFDGES